MTTSEATESDMVPDTAARSELLAASLLYRYAKMPPKTAMRM